MKIDYEYLQKYYHQMAEDQIADDYRKQGYTVSTEYQLGKYRADLFVENGKEKVVIEVKTKRLNAQSQKRLSELAEYVKTLGDYKFRVAIVTPPKNRHIVVNGLEEALSLEMNSCIPDDIDVLATHSRIEDVSDIDIQTITVKGNKINCIGTGVLEANLQYGSDSDLSNDDGWDTVASFAFTFNVSLTVEGNRISKIDTNDIQVDTSNF